MQNIKLHIVYNKLFCPLVAIALVLIMVLFCSCSNFSNKDNESSEFTFFDCANRKLELHKPVNKVFASNNPILNNLIILGNGTSKYLSAFGKKNMASNLYSKILEDWEQLPSVWDTNSPVNKEMLINLAPDIALIPEKNFSTQEKYFQDATLDVFVASYEYESFENIKSALLITSKLFNQENRAQRVINEFDRILNDTTSCARNISNKPRVAFLGPNLYSIASNNMIQNKMIEMAGGEAVSLSNDNESKFLNIDAETINRINPDFIFVPSYGSYNANDILNDDKLSAINAVKSKKVFVFPSNLDPWDWNTCSCCLGTAWILHTLHPDLYSEDKLLSTAQNFYKLLYNHEFDLSEF